MKTFRDITTALLLLLWSYAAASKLLAFEEFKRQLHNQPIAHSLADVLHYVIPAAELLTLVLLLRSKSWLTGMWCSAILLTVFTGYIGLVLAGAYDRIPCSCGGILSGMGWHIHLVFNLTFLILDLVTIITDPRGKPKTFEQSRQVFSN